MLAAVDVDQRAFLLALIAVEDAQRNAHAGADRLRAIGIVGRGVICEPACEGRIGRAVRHGQLVVGLGLLNRLQRRLQVGPRRQRGIAVGFQRLQRIAEIEWTRHIELVYRGAVIQHLQELNFRGAQIDDRRFDLRLVLHAQ